MSESDKIDEYELINCIATGSATQIWEVKKSGSAQPLAMKLLLEEALLDPEQKKSLKHEATIGKSMEHPSIIQIYDLKITKKLGYYTMEFFRSGNLKSLIRNDHAQAQGRVKKVMEALSQALGYFHDKGWVHRDVKPDNVLLNKGGEVRLIDFSLSSKPSNAILRAMTKKSRIVIQGTRTYLAPELIRREALTPSADIYSLGVLLYEALTGNPPFRTANPNDLLMMHVRDKPVRPSEIDDNISPDADDLVLRLLAKQVKERPASMQEVFAAVRGITFFKEDPVKVQRERKEALEMSDAQAAEDRLDSRRDASRDRSKDGESKPAPKPKPKPIPVAEKKPQPPPPQQQQPMPGYPPQPGMPQPGMPHPGMPMPGYPGTMPGQMPPGYPMAPGMMPGYPGGMPGFPQQPGMMPGQMPPGYPPQPGMPPGYPQPGMPYPGAPQPGGMPPQPGPPAGQQGAQPPQPGAPAPTPGAPQQQSPPTAPPTAPQQTQRPQPSAPSAPPAEQQKPKEDIPLATFDDLEIE